MTTFEPKNYLMGRRIRRERTMWSMTQEELADRLGISANYLGQIERGTRELSRKMEYRLCSLFSMTHEDLYGTAEQNISAQDADQVAENGLIFHDLSERDLHRLLHSCTPEELQLCGHLIRSLLHYTRVYGKEISCLSEDYASHSSPSDSASPEEDTDPTLDQAPAQITDSEPANSRQASTEKTASAEAEVQSDRPADSKTGSVRRQSRRYEYSIWKEPASNRQQSLSIHGTG